MRDHEVNPSAVADLTAIDPEHVKNTELLNAELPDPRFVDASYLHWLYDRNPLGAGIFDSVDDDDGSRLAHYALIPHQPNSREFLLKNLEQFLFGAGAPDRIA